MNEDSRKGVSRAPISLVASIESSPSYGPLRPHEVAPSIGSSQQGTVYSSSHDSNNVVQDATSGRAMILGIHQEPSHAPRASHRGKLSFDLVETELVCPIIADDIQNRWLSSYIPTPEQTIKEYPANVVSFMSRVFKSYAAIAVNGRGVPPFVHSTQMIASETCPPLSTCLTLVRLFARPFPGSKDAAVSTIQHEMGKIYPVKDACDSMTLLGTFQAYLIYTIVLYFSLDDVPKTFLRQTMMIIQELACASSHQGLVCLAEQQSTRPRWESWIIAEAKRRTLYVMCMFDSILLSREGLPNYLSIELKGLPAPATKNLWQPCIRSNWERLYNTYLAEWPDEGLRIDELWPLPPDLDQAGIDERSRRVDLWLETVDEFGTMLFAVTNCTHGS